MTPIRVDVVLPPGANTVNGASDYGLEGGRALGARKGGETPALKTHKKTANVE